jgi:hypothetical protein
MSAPVFVETFSTQIFRGNPFAIKFNPVISFQDSPYALTGILGGFNLKIGSMFVPINWLTLTSSISFFIFLIALLLFRTKFLFRLLGLWLILIVLFTKILPNQGNSLIIGLESVRGIGVVASVISIFRVPSALLSILLSLSTFASLFTFVGLLMPLHTNKSSKVQGMNIRPLSKHPASNHNFKKLYAFLLALVILLSGISIFSEANVLKDVGYYNPFPNFSAGDVQSANWIFQHNHNDSSTIWLPNSNEIYPFSFELTSYLGTKVNTFPRFTDGQFTASYFDYAFQRLLEGNNTQTFARFLSDTGIQYIVINEEISNNYFVNNVIGFSGHGLMHIFNKSQYFQLSHRFGSNYIFTNSIYKNSTSGYLGYNLGGFEGLSVYSNIQEHSAIRQSNIIFSPIDMNYGIPITWANGTLLETSLSSINDIVASIVMNNNTLYSNDVIPTSNSSDPNHIGFDSNLLNWWVFADNSLKHYLYQYPYNENLPIIFNTAGVYNYSQEINHTSVGNYTLLIRYLNGNGTGNISVNVGANTYNLPKLDSQFTGFSWYPIEINLTTKSTNIHFLMNGSMALNSLIILTTKNYQSLISESNFILSHDEQMLIYQTKQNNSKEVYLPTGYNYSISTLSKFNGTLILKTTSGVSYSYNYFKDETKIIYLNHPIVSILTTSNTTGIISLTKPMKAKKVILFNELFQFPMKSITWEGVRYNTYLFQGVSSGIVIKG